MRDGLYFTGFILFAAVLLYLGWDLIAGSVLLTWGLTFGGGTALATLFASVYRLQIEVKKSRRELERNRLELSFAHEVQETLLPRPMDNRGGLEFAGICLPARGVSGDYYDILSLTDDRLALAIADISGKGVPAAILMSNLQAVLRTVTKTSSHPLDVCARLNQHLYEVTRDSRFATFFYAEWHPGRRRLSYINAGHNPPILLASQGTRRLTKGGLPLGLFPQIDYEMGEHSLEPGDMLVLYSDGITEHESEKLGEFGDKRLEAVLEANKARPLNEIEQRVLAAVGDWSDREREDDMTLVLARATVYDQELA